MPGNFDNSQNKSIEEHLRRCSQSSPYPFEAFLLIYQSIPRNDTPQLSVEEISPKALIDSITNTGVLWSRAKSKTPQKLFSKWNLDSPEDLGRILKIMSNENILRCGSDNFFDNPETTIINFVQTPRLSLQWSVSTMFVFTLVSAIVIYGFNASGISGSLVSLFGAGLVLTGCVSLWTGLRTDQDGILEMVVGIMSLLIGAVLFWYVRMM